MSGQRPAPVVAELGRPETAEETAARKARDRRLRRSRQTARNLILALIATLAIAGGILALSPTAPAQHTTSIDYRSAAAQGSATTSQPLLAPDLASTWKATSAELRRSDGVTAWTVGFVTPKTAFLGFAEGLDANATWLDDTMDHANGGAVATVGGLRWRVYDRRGLGSSAGNVAYGLTTRIGSTWLAVYGTATPADTRAFAATLAADARTKGLTGPNTVPEG